MARDRFFMAIALVGLTASIVWVGNHVEPNGLELPKLITTGLSIESPASIQAAVSEQLGKVPRINHLRHPRWCKKKRPNSVHSIRIPMPLEPPAAPNLPSASKVPKAS